MHLDKSRLRFRIRIPYTWITMNVMSIWSIITKYYWMSSQWSLRRFLFWFLFQRQSWNALKNQDPHKLVPCAYKSTRIKMVGLNLTKWELKFQIVRSCPKNGGIRGMKNDHSLRLLRTMGSSCGQTKMYLIDDPCLDSEINIYQFELSSCLDTNCIYIYI